MTVTPIARSQKRKVNAARKHLAEHCIAEVLEVCDEGLRLRSGDWEGRGQRSDGCLLELHAGDTVACLVDSADDGAWVLSVLRRAEGSAPRIRCDGNLTLSADSLNLESEDFSLRSSRSMLCSDETTVIGREMSVTGQLFNLAGDALSTVFDRVTHFCQSHLRTTEGMDRVEANYLETSAKQIHRTQSAQVLVNGENLVKTRGKQIHFG